ncbi:hypothetical protein PMI04_016140 [Sphingobium sp. AP49]|uniref:hypothetical protein n=1 Tax=Sphingobium sp. AP49 TaxID=1144307 RepID=UPI00026ED172|nr:hypothetical protein [Sphingobium sp. AP49]WHO38078.1 hypothetical protein PMI04_016140 [Sphingobium sp. AP49]
MADHSRRQEGLQRVQIGLTGLAGVILLVGLANIVIDKARVDDIAAAPSAVPTIDVNAAVAATAPKEPLAELGVQPAPEQAPIVPDLQPDPNLKKPMDREPAPQTP